MNYKTKLATAFATASILVATIAPFSFADVNVTVSGNGSHSNNTVNVTNNNSVNVTQSNTAIMVNGVWAGASTGGNHANGNTGGNVTVTSGNATVNVTAVNSGGGNNAWLTPPPAQNVTVSITDNGHKSTNKETVKNDSKVKVNQSNFCGVGNFVGTSAKTGKNKSNNNTNGTVGVTSGDSSSSVTVGNTCGDNTLNGNPTL